MTAQAHTWPVSKTALLVALVAAAAALVLSHSAGQKASAAFHDSDLDGHPDIEEVAAGSDSLNPLSVPEEKVVELMTGVPVCSDGIDNDLDSAIDGADSGCIDSDSDLVSDPVETAFGSDPGNPASGPEDAAADAMLAYYGAWFAFPLAFCNDGIDNDLDGLTDGADPGCAALDADGDSYSDEVEKTFGSHAASNASVPENEAANPGSCSDSVDNDLDGSTDGADPNCGSPSYIFPVNCSLNDDCFYVNYVDQTPGAGISDYMCGLEAYEGHQGTDITLKDFTVMDQGVDVYAVQDGLVLATQDGFYDRNTSAGSFPSNLVIILHSDGYRTAYLHLRNGSVTVDPGDLVVQGQTIGQVGSSGSSTQPHLHLHVVDAAGAQVDPSAGPCGNSTSFWLSQDPYEDFFLSIDSYLLGYVPTLDDLKDGPPSFDVFPPAAVNACYGTQVLSIHAGDSAEYRFVDPSGNTAAFIPKAYGFYSRHVFDWGCAPAATLNSAPGLWQAQFYHNGALVHAHLFGVGTALDKDGDGCSDAQESGPNETLGGLRDNLNPYDFYDVNGDGVIELFADILQVIGHFAPTGTEPAYDVHYDRGPSAGPNPWNMTAPDGKIELFVDILGVIAQHAHDCR